MTGQVVLTAREPRQLLAAGASGRCERCGRLISRGRAAWSRDEYGVPVCEGCEPEPLVCRACRGAGTTGRHTYYDYRSPLGFASLRPVAHEVDVPCDRCGGDGLEPCAGCGERAATTETDLGPYCARCASAEEV